MRPANLSLARLYLRSIFGAKSLAEIRAGGRKSLLKAGGALLLGLVVAADLGFLFVYQNLSLYRALAPAGLSSLLFLNAATGSALAVFVLGFVTALSTYCLSPAEDSLLALPIDPRAFLGAKFLVVYLAELVFSLFLFGACLAVFGFEEGPPPAFYLAGALSALAAPLIPLALAYLILVPLMSTARLLRSRNAVMVVAGIVGLGFGLAFNLSIQASMVRAGDPAWLLANYAGPESLPRLLGRAYPPALLAWRALTLSASGEAWAGLAQAAAALLLGLGAALAAVLLLGGAYAASLPGFGESPQRRLERGAAEAYIRRAIRSSPLPLALLRREIRLMNREPVYLLNGPLVIALMPAVAAVTYIAQRDIFAELASARGLMEGFPAAGLLLAAAAGAFLGSATSITSTSLSRDARALAYLKALPIPPAAYMLAKLAHGLLFAAAGAATGALGLGLALRLGAAASLGAFLAALAFSALACLLGLWLDTASPMLSWDSPVAAMKRNPNALYAMLGAMGLIALLGLLASILRLGPWGFVLLYGGGSALLFCLLLLPYRRYAERRLAELEA